MEGTIGSFWQNTQSEAHIPHESRIICHNLFVRRVRSLSLFFYSDFDGVLCYLLVAAFNKTTSQMCLVLNMKIALKVLFGRVA